MTKLNARFMGWRPQQNGKHRVTIDIDAADASKLSELTATGRFIALSVGDALPPPPVPARKATTVVGGTPLEDAVAIAKASEDTTAQSHQDSPDRFAPSAETAAPTTLVFEEQAPTHQQPVAQEPEETGSPFGG
jgi:hypothetical protein